METKIEKSKYFSSCTALLSKVVFLFAFFLIFTPLSAQAKDAQAAIISRSHQVINLLPGKSITFTIKFKNTGEKPWKGKDGSIYLKPVTGKSVFVHKFWPAKDTASTISHTINPQQEVVVKFALKAPEALGLYEEKFVLALSDNEPITGSMFAITVNSTLYPTAKQPAFKPQSPKPRVLSATDKNQKTPNIQSVPTPASKPIQVKKLSLNKQPDITVGLFFTEPYSNPELISLTADTVFNMYVSNIKQGIYGPGSIVSVSYKSGVYNITLPNKKIVSFSEFPTFKLQGNGRFEITSYTNKAKWNQGINYNKFEGDIIIKYNPRTKRLWVINKLPLEKYLEGITETSNINLPEYQKTIAVAARSYALYRIMNNKKYNGFFNIHRVFDQVYNGYASKISMPNYIKAVKDTYGKVMVYDGRPVLAKYFTQSGGQTKSAKQVWGYDIPYLKSVAVPWDKGRRLLGHGVGMSLKAARDMAKEGKKYQSILKYFYQGIDLQKVY